MGQAHVAWPISVNVSNRTASAAHRDRAGSKAICRLSISLVVAASAAFTAPAAQPFLNSSGDLAVGVAVNHRVIDHIRRRRVLGDGSPLGEAMVQAASQ